MPGDGSDPTPSEWMFKPNGTLTMEDFIELLVMLELRFSKELYEQVRPGLKAHFSPVLGEEVIHIEGSSDG